MSRVRGTAVCALCLGAGAAWAGPVSQWGGAGGGTMVLAHEPQVDLLATHVDVTVTGDRARVTVAWTLKGPPVDREIMVELAAAMVPTESDGDGSPAPAWTDVSVAWDGVPLKSGPTREPRARTGLACEGAPGAVADVERVRVRMKAGRTGVLRLAYATSMTHDDWRTGERVEQSARRLCVRPRPVGFAGATAGLFRATVRVEAAGTPQVSVGKLVEGAWVTEETTDLGKVPDVHVEWTPAAR